MPHRHILNILTDRPDLEEWVGMTDKEPMTIEDLSTKVDGLAKTVDNLAALVQSGFTAMEQKMEVGIAEVKAEVRRLEARMDRQFDERTFNPEEKETVVAASDAYNQQLEDATLGMKDITLTRPEYDATAVVADFPNRFTSPAGAFAD